jgi:hypothetical protein
MPFQNAKGIQIQEIFARKDVFALAILPGMAEKDI